tara:strand:+ start:4328 stop:4681 length:354 start_codon:yes stop_codon:yes gene_type:complete
MQLILTGLGVSQGIVKGKVKVINGKDDHPHFEEDDILVTHLTDPTMVPMMSKSSGIICNIGGLTSHPSIVSREMGIPCIVSADKATTILKDGDIIQFDGKTGEIHKIDDKNWNMRWK